MTIQLKATVHYFPECDAVRYAVQGGPGFVDEMICSNLNMKATMSSTFRWYCL